MRVVLFGPPGAGKGTVGKMLAEKYGVPHASSGDFLRAESASGSQLGRNVKKLIDAGTFVGDELINDIMLTRLAGKEFARGFILDGWPRNESQAGTLDAFLAKNRMPLNAAINIDIPEEEIVRRLSMRLVCLSCRAVYNEEYKPASEGKCSKCGGEIGRRADEDPETIRKRIDVYEKETAPLLGYYEKAGKLVRATGDSSDAIFESLLKRLGERKA